MSELPPLPERPAPRRLRKWPATTPVPRRAGYSPADRAAAPPAGADVGGSETAVRAPGAMPPEARKRPGFVPAGPVRDPDAPAAVPDGRQPPAALQTPAAARRRQSRSKWATFFLAASIVITIGFFAVVAVGSLAYVAIAREVPDPGQLLARRSTFASTKVFDRSGSLIVELSDPTDVTAGRRIHVPLDQMSPWVWKATTATEDPNFFRYSVGFDPVAIARIVYYLFTERDVVSGGSTITQQVARNLLLSPEERTERTLIRKLREIVLANELSRRYPRETILEIYLNDIYYGNLSYGIEAAAQTYFGKQSKDLSLPEAAFLAGIPQSPVYWDPVEHEDRTLRRMADVLRLMAKAEYISETQIDPAISEMQARDYQVRPLNVSPVAPHFMTAVRQELDSVYGRRLYQEPGLKVYTTLSPTVQAVAEQAVKVQIAKLKDRNVTNAAVVAIDPRSGEVLAMVGSVDFYDEKIKGQVNVALAQRQPGSSIKPFTYLAAMEKGATPATLYWDLSTTFTNQYGQKYTPKNYDDQFHGPMLMREALARSMNVPAVKALDDVGLPAFFAATDRAGIKFPPNPQYGLAVTLGGAEARLLDLTGGYAAIANAGVYLTPTLIMRIETNDGKVLFDIKGRAGVRAFAPEHAYLITSILGDNVARSKSYGSNSVLNLPRPAAVKTGTTNDTRDNLTVGYTPDLVVGVWAGNTDNTPMKNVSGVEGAAPIWRQIMDNALKGRPVLQFARPAGVVSAEICLDGGHQPSDACPPARRATELFKAGQGPLQADENVERAVRAGDPALAQTPQPGPANQSADIIVTNPPNGGAVGRAVLSIRGIVNPPGFESYQVEWGTGDNPGEWKWISGPHLSPVINEQITQWSTDGLPSGRYTIRVTVFTAGGLQRYGYSRFDVR